MGQKVLDQKTAMFSPHGSIMELFEKHFRYDKCTEVEQKITVDDSPRKRLMKKVEKKKPSRKKAKNPPPFETKKKYV